MASVQVQVAQGCIVTWKKVVPKSKSVTVGELRTLIEADPQNFMGDVNNVDFRTKPGGDVLSETTVVKDRVFAKKRDSKNKAATKKAATSSSSGAARKKKVINEEALVVDLPQVVGAPIQVQAAGTRMILDFASDKDCDDFMDTMCTEWGVDLEKIKKKKASSAKAAELAALKARLAELEHSEQEEQDEQVVKKKVLKQVAKTAVAAAAATATTEEEEEEEEEEEVDLADEEEVEEEVEVKPKEIKQPTTKVSKATMQKLNQLRARGIHVDEDVDFALQSSDEEDVFKPKERASKK